jgi:glycosyltransferase involved in cell wall biosynthesis
VYNGANYVEFALSSLCNQDYRDIEILIGDNASTDDTVAICRKFMLADDRIKLFPSVENRGAAWNYNRLVEPASGEYFMWAAHDDVFSPAFVSKCVEALDEDPGAVLCSTGVQRIDADGAPVDRWHLASPRRSNDPTRRFADVLRRPQWHQAFGLIRLDVLRSTRLFGAYSAADGVLLAELALCGRFIEIPEPLFSNRDHRERSTKAYPSLARRAQWWDPQKRDKRNFTRWRLLREYAMAISRSSLGTGEKFQAALELWSWAIVSWKLLLGEFVGNLRR